MTGGALGFHPQKHAESSAIQRDKSPGQRPALGVSGLILCHRLFRLVDPGLARAISAGAHPAERVHPVVVDAMREVRIDLSDAKPQKLTAELAREQLSANTIPAQV